MAFNVPFWADFGSLRQWLSRTVMTGKINCTGSVTLTANSATTTYNDPRIGADSAILLFPTTANGATEFGAGTLRISTPGTGTATITHANNAQTDRTFKTVILG